VVFPLIAQYFLLGIYGHFDKGKFVNYSQ